MKGKKPLHLRYPLDYTDFRSKYSHPLKTVEYKERRLHHPHFQLKKSDPLFRREWAELLEKLRQNKITRKEANKKFSHMVAEAIQRRKSEITTKSH